MLTRQFQYNSRAALRWVFRKSTAAEHLNLAKFRSYPANWHLNLDGYHLPYKYVCTHRFCRADLGGCYFDQVVILTKILPEANLVDFLALRWTASYSIFFQK